MPPATAYPPEKCPGVLGHPHEFMDRYGVAYQGVDAPAVPDKAALTAEAEANFKTAMSVLRRDDDW